MFDHHLLDIRVDDVFDPFGVARAAFCAWAVILNFWLPPVAQKKIRKKRRRG